MKNKEKPFCESAQRTKSYVTDEQKGFDTKTIYQKKYLTKTAILR